MSSDYSHARVLLNSITYNIPIIFTLSSNLKEHHSVEYKIHMIQEFSLVSAFMFLSSLNFLDEFCDCPVFESSVC